MPISKPLTKYAAEQIAARPVSMQTDLFILNSKRNAHVCLDSVQSHYDEKIIHDNRSTSQNEIRAKCSLDMSFKLYSLVQSLHFSTHASSKQKKTRQNMVNFYSIKHRKFNLCFICCSVYIVLCSNLTVNTPRQYTSSIN